MLLRALLIPDLGTGPSRKIVHFVLECKIAGRTVQSVIREKFELEQETGKRVYFP